VIDLSIVIVSFNAGADLERCLSSLHDPPPAVSHEIIVVDNASTDESVRAARKWPDVQVIESPTNRGFAAANNEGIRRSVGDTLLLLNPDTIVPPGAIDRLVTELRNHPDAAAIGPRLIAGNGHAELSFGSMIAPLAELKQRRLMRGLERGDPTVRGQVDAMTRVEQWPDWVSGACLLVWRRDAEAVGLLDERYVMYTEDVDFCAALRARGRRVLFTPAVEVVHLRGRSAATAPDATRAAYRRSHLAFYQKHHPALTPFLRLYHWLRPL
jgi:N-acetylglucosaminyl-diphospho-decaprenol L-rhamnosyltransferase